VSQERVSFTEIFSVLILRTLPLTAIAVFLLIKARSDWPLVASAPEPVYNATVMTVLLLIAKLTAGRMMRRLANEGKHE
jgi:hypothetical protein